MMPAHNHQRARLAAVLKWAQATGWERGAYPGQYRSGRLWVQYVALTSELIIDRYQEPVGWVNHSTTKVSSIDEAINILAALGLVPADLCALYGAGLAVGTTYHAGQMAMSA